MSIHSVGKASGNFYRTANTVKRINVRPVISRGGFRL